MYYDNFYPYNGSEEERLIQLFPPQIVVPPIFQPNRPPFPPGPGRPPFPPGPGRPPFPPGPGRPPFFPPISQINRCLNRQTFIILNNGSSFWFYPTFISQNNVFGFRWRRNGWEQDSINLNRIISATCS